MKNLKLTFLSFISILLFQFGFSETPCEMKKHNLNMDSLETSSQKFTAFRTSPLPIFLGSFYSESWGMVSSDFQLNLEKSIAKNQSLQFDLSVIGENIWWSYDFYREYDTTTTGYYYSWDTTAYTYTQYEYYNTTLSGIGISFMYKYYINPIGKRLNLYYAPRISYSYAKLWEIENKVNYVKLHKAQQAIVLGAQYIIKRNFSIDVSTGIGFSEKASKANLPSNYTNDFENYISYRPFYYFNVGLGISLFH